MTATELLTVDDTFLQLVLLWQKEKEMPVPLIDRLLDFGLERQSEGAKWMGTERPKSPVYLVVPYNCWSWWLTYFVIRPHYLPATMFVGDKSTSYIDRPTFELACAAALDAWKGDGRG